MIDDLEPVLGRDVGAEAQDDRHCHADGVPIVGAHRRHQGARPVGGRNAGVRQCVPAAWGLLRAGDEGQGEGAEDQHTQAIGE